jgi:hypothetical protein
VAAAAGLFERVEFAKDLLRDVGLPRRARPICGRSLRFHTKNELSNTPTCLQNRAMLTPLAGCRSIRSRQNCSRSPLVRLAISEPFRDRD